MWSKGHPKGSIAEGYLAEECLTFCFEYLFRIETKFNHPIRNKDSIDENQERILIFSMREKAKGKGKFNFLDQVLLTQAHNCFSTV